MRAQTIGSFAGSQTSARAQTLAAVAMATLFGAFLLWGVGFSSIAVFHNAAHDTRHSMAFPCH